MKSYRFNSVVPYVLFLILGVFFFPSAGRDDVHITYWAAHTLSNFGEILNYNGNYIEQSSSLLHTLVLAFVHYFSGFNIVTIGGCLSILFGLTTIYMTGKLGQTLKINNNLPQLIVATTVPFVYWSFGGLETTMVATVILFLLFSLVKVTTNQSKTNYLLSAISILLYLLIRPESFIVLTCFFIFLIILFYLLKDNYYPVLFLFIISIIFFTGIVLFRYNYFDAIFPQPVKAKIGMSIFEKIINGVQYYLYSLKQYPLFIILIIPLISYLTINIKQVIEDRIKIIIISFLLVYGFFILTAGGDWMEGARFFVPIIGVIIALAVSYYLPLIGKKKILIYGLSMNLLVLIYFTNYFSTGTLITNFNNYSSTISPESEYSFFEIANRVHYRDIKITNELKLIMKEFTSNNVHPVIMSSQGGFINFHVFKNFYKKATYIDIRGLCTSQLTECEITNSLEKSSTGIGIDYQYFFSNLQLLQEQCNIVKPDIIFALDNRDEIELIESNGYEVIYLQFGEITQNGFLKGSKVMGDQFIAVKREYVNLFDLKIKTYEFLVL